jgi:hypothetical protein
VADPWFVPTILTGCDPQIMLPGFLVLAFQTMRLDEFPVNRKNISQVIYNLCTSPTQEKVDK